MSRGSGNDDWPIALIVIALIIAYVVIPEIGALLLKAH